MPWNGKGLAYNTKLTGCRYKANVDAALFKQARLDSAKVTYFKKLTCALFEQKKMPEKQ